jgi:O-antigen/teichoic acid export membrane protein
VLAPADYAVLDTLNTLGLLVTALATLGLNGAMAVFFYDGDDEHQRRVVMSAATVGVAWALCVASLLVVVAQPLAQATLGSAEWALLLYLSAANLPFAVLVAVLTTALRLQLAVKQANILALGNLALTIALNVLFVLIVRWGVFGITLTIFITTLAQAVAGALLLQGQVWGRPAWNLIGRLVRAGLPFLPGALSYWALAYLDRLILPAFGVPLADRGLYAIAARLASMLAVALIPFQNAWGPLALSIRAAPEAERMYVKVLTYATAGGLGLALAVALFAREILLVFTTPAYADAAPLVAPLAYVAVANAVGVAVGVGALLAKRTSVTGLAILLGAVLNLVLNVVLIPRFGVWGAAWATAAGYALTPAVLYIGSQRVYPLPYEIGRVVLALGAQAALLAAGMWLAPPGWPGFGMRVVLLLAYPVALLALRVVELRELAALVSLVSAVREKRSPSSP